jgi:sugar phosphate isomerase/epimerase
MKIRPGFIFVECKYSYPPSITELEMALRDWARLGFKYVELEIVNATHLREMHRNKEFIKGLCNDLGLSITSLIAILPHLGSLEEAQRQASLSYFNQALDIAGYFGCEIMDLDSFTPSVQFVDGLPYLEVAPPPNPPEVIMPEDFCWGGQWDAFVGAVIECNRRAKGAGIRLEIHPRTYELISGTDSFLRLADCVNDMNLGVILDTAHSYMQREIIPISISKLSSKIMSVHVSDSNGFQMDHLPLGEGNIDWESVLQALYKSGFDGQFVIDVGGHSSSLDKAFQDSKRILEGHISRVWTDRKEV